MAATGALGTTLLMLEFKGVIDKEEVPAANFKAVRPFLKAEGFDPEKILKKSNLQQSSSHGLGKKYKKYKLI